MSKYDSKANRLKAKAYLEAMQALKVGDPVMVRAQAWGGEWRKAVITGRNEQRLWEIDGHLYGSRLGSQVLNTSTRLTSGTRDLVPLHIWEAGIWRPRPDTGHATRAVCISCGADKGARASSRCLPCDKTHKKALRQLAAERAERPRYLLDSERMTPAEAALRQAAAAARAARHHLEQAPTQPAQQPPAPPAPSSSTPALAPEGFRQGDLLILGPRLAQVVDISPDGGVWVASNTGTACYSPEYLLECSRPLTPTGLRKIGLLPPINAGINGYTYFEIHALCRGASHPAVHAQARLRPAFDLGYAEAIELECARRDEECGRLPPEDRPAVHHLRAPVTATH